MTFWVFIFFTVLACETHYTDDTFACNIGCYADDEGSYYEFVEYETPNLVGTEECFRDAHSISPQVWSKPKWNSGWSYVKISTHLIFALTNHFLNMCYFCPEDGSCMFLPNVGSTYQAARCCKPSGHNMDTADLPSRQFSGQDNGKL